MHLAELGWTEQRQQAFAPHATEGLVPGRVAVEHKSAYGLYVEGGELRATLAGRLRRGAGESVMVPAVGDWVAVHPPAGDGQGVIHAVLPRAGTFTRRAAGRNAEQQVVAANVDVVLLVVALTEDPNPRRLERYVAMAWESGAQPVVVLSKSDLVQDADERQRVLEAAAAGVPVLRTSAVRGDGMDALRAYVGPGRTLAMLGPSGVGKSRLVNALLGVERQQIGAVRAYDGKGRHTTTRRELVALPGGGLVLDTPGMRELQLWDAAAGLAEAFTDVDELAGGCRFRDCSHTSEPHCAVLAAAAAGRLAPARLASYQRLRAEMGQAEAEREPAEGRARKRRARSADKALKSSLKRKSD